MKAVKYIRHLPTFHVHMNNDAFCIYIPEKKASIYREFAGSFGKPENGISTMEFKDGNLID